MAGVVASKRDVLLQRGRQVQVWLDGEGGYRLRVFGATIGLNVRCLAYGT